MNPFRARVNQFLSRGSPSAESKTSAGGDDGVRVLTTDELRLLARLKSMGENELQREIPNDGERASTVQRLMFYGRQIDEYAEDEHEQKQPGIKRGRGGEKKQKECCSKKRNMKKNFHPQMLKKKI